MTDHAEQSNGPTAAEVKGLNRRLRPAAGFKQSMAADSVGQRTLVSATGDFKGKGAR